MSVARPSKDEIFNKAAELADDQQRQAYLAEVCQGDSNLRREIEELLEQDRAAGSFLETPPTGVDVPVNGSFLEKPGTEIGPYQLLERIGQGGMGVVYLAEQTTPVRRRVALKIIKPGMDTQQVIKRFEAERQALSMMDHPNIARVLDAGATETGRPYFVMEWVKGLPITRYCDEHQLTPRERLEIFATVCQAVQHSHQKGIIHRDIKPSNVLVSESDGRPVAKVIDFGLAKATGRQQVDKTEFTRQGQIVGTVEYMSPEQANLNPVDVDTRTDIYSLGVLLYELLTGETPFDRKRLRSAAFDELLRIVREEEPLRPSVRLSSSESLPSIAANRHCEPKKLSTLVRGELDWIVMKALEKDRTRRYETANGFASDVRRYLNDETVQACPPSAAYRFKKFVSRNKVAFATTVAILLCVIAGITGTTWQAIRATAQRDRAAALELEARTETDRANAVLALVEEMLLSADPEKARGKDYTVRELLDEFSASLEDKLQGQPEAEATIRTLIGRAYLRVAPEESRPHLRRALELRRRFSGLEHEKVADSLLDYAWCHWEAKEYEVAERYGRDALETYRNVTNNPESVIATLRLLQLSLGEQGKVLDSVAIGREAIAVAADAGSIETADLASILHVSAATLRSQGHPAEAEELGRQAVAMHRRTNGEQHPETAWGLSNLSGASEMLGKHADAARYRREALAIFRLSYEDDHKSIGGCLPDLTRALIAQQDYAAAAEVWRETLDIRLRQFGTQHTLTAEALSELGHVLELLGDQSEAEQRYQEALSIWRQLAEEEPENDRVHWRMAEHYAQRSQFSNAISEYEKATQLAPAWFYDAYKHALLCAVTKNAEKYREVVSSMLQRFAARGSVVIKYYSVWSCALAPDAVDDYELPITLALNAVESHPDSERYVNAIGAILFRAGRHDQAIERLTELSLRYKSSNHTAPSSPAYTCYFLAMAHKMDGDDGKAREYLAEANAYTDEVLADRDPSGWNHREALKLLREETQGLIDNSDTKETDIVPEPNNAHENALEGKQPPAS